MLRSLLLLAVALPACGGAPASVGVSRSAIIGGASDGSDPAVVLVLLANGGRAPRPWCSGSVVSPHVVLTAAHCIDPVLAGADASFSLFLGADPAAAAPPAPAVVEAHFDAAFDGAQLGNGHDVGVLVTKDPLPVAPLPIERHALDGAMVGSAIRLVGYGTTSADDYASAGTRRSTPTTVASLDDALLSYSDDGHMVCGGDSGGPSLAVVDGEERIVGIHSWVGGRSTCTGGGHDQRVDRVACFVDRYVAAHDPSSLPAMTTGEAGCDPADVVDGSTALGGGRGCSAGGPLAPGDTLGLLAGVALALSIVIVAGRDRRRRRHR